MVAKALRGNTTLTIGAGETAVTVDARIVEAGSGRTDGFMADYNYSHSSTVPLIAGLEVGDKVTDGEGKTYRVYSVKEILGRYRLKLTRE